MRVVFVNVALASTLLLSSPALATDSSSPAAPNADEIVCKSLPPATGTRLGARRICKTQGEWDRERVQAQDTLSRTQIQRGVSNTGN